MNTNPNAEANLATTNPTLDATVDAVVAKLLALANSGTIVTVAQVDSLGIIGPNSTILALAGFDTPGNAVYLGNSAGSPLPYTVSQYFASQLNFLSTSGKLTTAHVSLRATNPNERATLTLILSVVDKVTGVRFATITYLMDLVVSNGGNSATINWGQRVSSR